MTSTGAVRADIRAERRFPRSRQLPRVGLVARGSREREIIELVRPQVLSLVAFADVEALLRDARADELDVIVVWLEQAAESLTMTTEPLIARFGDVPLVVCCSEIERWELRAALAGGLAGLVLHEALPDALGPCLRGVHAGQLSVPRRHRRIVDPPALSAREKQVLGLVVMGYMNSQIAQRLFVAESTVKSHLSSAFAKLGVRSRNEAVDVILDPEHGLGTGILGLGVDPVRPESV